MAARYVKDSRDRSHYVLHQEMRMSCGPACVAMIEDAFKQKCMNNGEVRIRQISQNYPGKFTAAGGTGIDNLAAVMRAEGIPTYAPVHVPKGRLFAYFRTYVGPRTPIIAQVMWLQPETITMMTHYTVLKQIDIDNLMIFLDPMNDVVEVPHEQLVKETYTYQTKGGSKGQLTGWIIVPHLRR
ncbi:MAG: papain-like cysteine protease family protein [Acidobacteriota bacterium]